MLYTFPELITMTRRLEHVSGLAFGVTPVPGVVRFTQCTGTRSREGKDQIPSEQNQSTSAAKEKWWFPAKITNANVCAFSLILG